MLRRVRVILPVVLLFLLLPMLPSAYAQSDGENACAAALATASGGAKKWNGYKIVWAPQQGSTGSNVVLGTGGSDTLFGGTGSDLLCGFEGDDTLLGGTGGDILVGGPGADALYGETGDDTLYTDAQDVVASGGTGRNQIIVVSSPPTVPEGSCWWLSDETGEWTSTEEQFGTTLTYRECQEYDSCTGGGGTTPGCYKWTVGPNDDFGGWLP